jgi:hypothetical protein
VPVVWGSRDYQPAGGAPVPSGLEWPWRPRKAEGAVMKTASSRDEEFGLERLLNADLIRQRRLVEGMPRKKSETPPRLGGPITHMPL